MSAEVKDQSEAAPFLEDGNGVKKPPKEQTEPINEDAGLEDKETTSGFWIFKGPSLQRIATGTIFVTIFGITCCFMSMSFAYFNSTMTTLEKRYKIPTKVLGILSTGNDISGMFSAIIIGYYLRKVHRPRWMGLGYLIITVFCIMNASLHFLYGAGEDALKLTQEFGDFQNITGNSTVSLSSSQLCTSDKTKCLMDIESWAPIVILFIAQLILGIGAGIVIIVGVAYMDDNTAKSKAPAMLTLSTFLRMLGPSAGYLLSSQCLKLYIDPRLTPLIKNTDPRWMGAWWLGYILLAVITLLSAFVIALFPKELPSAKLRRLKQTKAGEPDPNEHKEHSLSNMWQSVKALATNKVYMYNMGSSIVYFFGYNVYWTFSQKYIEIQYRQSASVASMASGPVPLSFSAVGVVLSGYVIYKFKPGARSIVSWNVIVDILTVVGILCYSLIACQDSDNLGSMATTSDGCSASCHCDYALYSPICSPNNVTYTTACHAGCTGMTKDPDRTTYTGCKCISAGNITDIGDLQSAVDGHCPVDCTKQFYIFLAVMCFLKLVGASSKATNFLISLRCMPPDEKSFGLGLGSMITSLLAFIPSPIFYGWLIDKYCLVWGKTCSNEGNCWLYDTYSLRYVLNYTAATFVLLGSFFNMFVWYYAKDLQIFDENEEMSLSLKRKEENILQGLGSKLQLEMKEEKL
ncbi:hypothetical protein KR044_005011 [Drosophila immigrans]|nr:hypothetical protein KR044_005011 [Drosophila immigrans]